MKVITLSRLELEKDAMKLTKENRKKVDIKAYHDAIYQTLNAIFIKDNQK